MYETNCFNDLFILLPTPLVFRPHYLKSLTTVDMLLILSSSRILNEHFRVPWKILENKVLRQKSYLSNYWECESNKGTYGFNSLGLENRFIYFLNFHLHRFTKINPNWVSILCSISTNVRLLIPTKIMFCKSTHL